MKTILIILSFLLSSVASAQTVQEINDVLGFPDTLAVNEIRIYNRIGYTNSIDIFRLYRVKDKEWKTESYDTYYDKENTSAKNKYNEVKLRMGNTDETLVWEEIGLSGIANLPKWSVIQRKLKSYPKTVTYTNANTYTVVIRDNDRINTIEYYNPTGYLSEFPDVEELQKFCKMLSVISREFAIWEHGR